MNIFKNLFFSVLLILFFSGIVQAQETTYLAITQYESNKDQPILIQNNETIFEYYENLQGSSPVMLSVMTDAQKDTLLAKGFEIQIVEENPDMTTYRLLYNPLDNQASKLSAIGKIYVLTKNHTLLKINQESALNLTGNLTQFTIIPLQNIGIPENQAEVNTTANTKSVITNAVTNNITQTIVLIILFLSIVGVLAYLKLKKKQVN